MCTYPNFHLSLDTIAGSILFRFIEFLTEREFSQELVKNVRRPGKSSPWQWTREDTGFEASFKCSASMKRHRPMGKF